MRGSGVHSCSECLVRFRLRKEKAGLCDFTGGLTTRGGGDEGGVAEDGRGGSEKTACLEIGDEGAEGAEGFTRCWIGSVKGVGSSCMMPVSSMRILLRGMPSSSSARTRCGWRV